MQPLLTSKQRANIAREKERRRRQRQRRADEHHRRVARLQYQIEEARKRRQLFILMILLALLALQKTVRAAFTRSISYGLNPIQEPDDWTPAPENDFGPRLGHDDYCDGYSHNQWCRILDKRGIQISRKAELKAVWVADPERKRYPLRYQDWGYRPFIGEIMQELSAPYWQADALIALKLMLPADTHQYLEEACATDPGDLRRCLADQDDEIVQSIRNHAFSWEERKRREAEEMRKERNERKLDDDEKSFDP